MDEPRHISCVDCQEKLASTQLDDLPQDERTVLEKHLAGCTVCSTMLNEYREIDELVREAHTIELPPELGEDFWQKVEQREKESLQDAPQGEPKPEIALVGVGGTGKEVVRHFKRELLMHGYDQSRFQCLVIDMEGFDEPLGLDPRKRLQDEECLYIGDYDANEILKDLAPDSPIRKWWGNRSSTELPRVEDGAAQRRSVARLGFFKFFEKIEAQLRQMVQQFTSTENPSTTIEGSDQTSTGRPIIFLAFSLCGGTGSGLFFDVAYLLRELFKSSIHPPTIIALTMLPGPYFQSISSIPQQERIQANTYAALIELERLHNMALGLEPKIEGKYLWKVQYDAHLTVESEDLPLDYIYLLDAIDVRGRMYNREWVFEQMSRAIFWLSEPAVGARFRERASNLNHRALARDAHAVPSSEWRPPIYSALGVSIVKFDRQCEHLPLELGYMHTQRMREMLTGKPMLPSYLNTEIALIEEMTREQAGVSPFPFGSTPLQPVGTFDNRAEVNTTLKRFFTKYDAALRSLSSSPMWLRSKEQHSITILLALSECILEAFCMSGTTAILQKIEQIRAQLQALRIGIRAKMQEQQSHKSQVEQEFLSKILAPEPAGMLAKLFRNLLKLVDVVYVRDLTEQAKKAAHQLYRWYDASSRVIIYDDIVQSLLDPLLTYIGGQGRDLLDIEHYLNVWLTYSQPSASIQRNMQNWLWFEHIYPRFSVYDQLQQAIPQTTPNLNTTTQQEPQQGQLLLYGEVTQTSLMQKAIESWSIEEHLIERLLSRELTSKRQAFLERAECLWDFSYEGNKEIIPYLESINLLGYGIDPERDIALHVESGIQALFGDQSSPPEPVATHRRDELVLLKTVHGLTSSSIRSIKEMQQAYHMMHIVHRDPYLHLFSSSYQSSDITAPTPEKVIETWRELATLLTSSSELMNKINIAVRQYERATASALQEEIEVNQPDHPFFDLVDSLGTILAPLSPASYPLQVLKTFTAMEEMLRAQGWEKVEPVYHQYFDPKLHKKDEPFLDEEDEEAVEWASLTDPGRAFLKNVQRERECTLRVIDVIRPGYIHSETGKVRHALVIVSTESGSSHNPGICR